MPKNITETKQIFSTFDQKQANKDSKPRYLRLQTNLEQFCAIFWGTR